MDRPWPGYRAAGMMTIRRNNSVFPTLAPSYGSGKNPRSSAIDHGQHTHLPWSQYSCPNLELARSKGSVGLARANSTVMIILPG